MDIEKARRFIEKHHRAVMVTNRKDGRPQLSPVLVGLDEAGRAIVSTRAPTAKVCNLRRDPAVSLCVFMDHYFGPWIQIDGRAEIAEGPGVVDLLVDYYQRVVGEHPDWQEYRQAMVKEQRVLLRIAIERAGPG